MAQEKCYAVSDIAMCHRCIKHSVRLLLIYVFNVYCLSLNVMHMYDCCHVYSVIIVSSAS